MGACHIPGAEAHALSIARHESLERLQQRAVVVSCRVGDDDQVFDTETYGNKHMRYVLVPLQHVQLQGTRPVLSVRLVLWTVDGHVDDSFAWLPAGCGRVEVLCRDYF
jgi:hypothetical protein